MSTSFLTHSDSLNLPSSAKTIQNVHLRDLLTNNDRNRKFTVETPNLLFDYSRQQLTEEILSQLTSLYHQLKVPQKIQAMFRGECINKTENRPVLHVALRSPKTHSILVNGQNVIPEVHAVLDHIQAFSQKVRSGAHVGATGKALKNVISIGIGGSYLGPEFVYEALRFDPTAKQNAQGRSLRFLANVDPVDVERAIEDFNPEETLVIIISKTFTTAETMLNARTLRQWLVKHIQKNASNVSTASIIEKHMIAVSAAVPKAVDFGIQKDNIFGFWDWVGGRYSVCSSVGIVPLALQYGYDVCEAFLAGAHDMDEQFQSKEVLQNIPVLMGLLGVWNTSFLKYTTRAILPYTEALLRFPAHIQQLDMESNGKTITMDGEPLKTCAGPINFGEPGTNGQHSFYQLIHQGRIVPCEFIGYCQTQSSIEVDNEVVTNHDELMSNFFAQPDALAKGRTKEENLQAGIPEPLACHKAFSGNRPSFSLLFTRLDAFACGQLLALYEHRTTVEGFLWEINSFDQWGVELGKKLACQIRDQMIQQSAAQAKNEGKYNVPEDEYNSSTRQLLDFYFTQCKK